MVIGFSLHSAQSAELVDKSQGTSSLPRGVFKIQGIDPKLSFADLQPLEGIIGSSSVVALGETVHTSEGFSKAKQRLIRFMVEKLGFRVISFESPWVAANKSEDYIAGRDVSIEEALRGLFAVWRCESVRDLLLWLRQYNQAHPDDAVHFMGFDVQQPWDDIRSLRGFLERAIPDQSQSLLDEIRPCPGPQYASREDYYRADPNQRNVPQKQHENCLTGLSELRSYIELNRQALARATSDQEVSWAKLSLNGIEAWERMSFYERFAGSPEWFKGFEPRDRGMAEAFLTIRSLRFPTAKTIIWAANSHIARTSSTVAVVPTGPISIHFNRMGTFLAERLGKDYLPIGLIGYDIRTRDGDQPRPTSSISLELMLHRLGSPYFVVDMQAAWNNFLVPGVEYTMDRLPYPGYSLAKDFSALFYLDHSPQSRMLEAP